MNENDSEKLAGILSGLGYERADSTESAEIIILNTCSIRENADDKFFGHLGSMKPLKQQYPEKILAVCGCMMQQEQTVSIIRRKYRYVDIIFGTHNIHEFGSLLDRFLQTQKQVCEVWDDSPIAENVPAKREFRHKAFVSIMNGCNNYCTYCIVPYTRGREKSREEEYILDEITKLAEDGCREVMLLGQNVNSYGRTLSSPKTFAGLLLKTAQISGIERIRFMTSHPKDFSSDIIEAVKSSEKICSSVHLPLQSGSSRILRLMNRHYDKEKYFSIIDDLYRKIPDISVSTDIIVGFPGETEEDFEETIDAVKKVRFDSAFTFIYSPRSGTKAAGMQGTVPPEVIKERFERLIGLQHEITAQKSQKYAGTVQEVIVDGYSRTSEKLLSGRNKSNKLINFTGNAKIGDTVSVKISQAMTFYLLGEMIQ